MAKKIQKRDGKLFTIPFIYFHFEFSLYKIKPSPV